MATIRTNPLPNDYSPPDVSGAKVSPATTRRILPAGPAFVNHLRFTLHHDGSFAKHDEYWTKERERLEQLASSSSNIEDDLGVGEEPETQEILNLDPKEWKVHTQLDLGR